jgi:hypothetical protein
MTNQNAMTETEILKAQLAEAKAENHRLKNKAKNGLRVSEKGCVSLYGIRKFPVTFYAQEWENILDSADAIRAFIVEHPELKRKVKATDAPTEQSELADMVDELVEVAS